jgi:hypothetical protein
MATMTLSVPVQFDFEQSLPGGFRFPTRMTAVPLAEGGVALVSPIPISSKTEARLAAMGSVQYLIAPNLLHHLYLADAARRFPNAKVLAPARLLAKRPSLRVDSTLEDGLPECLTNDVDVIKVNGAPSVDEHVFYHRASSTLIVTDLVFNIAHARGFVAHLVLTLVGCHGRLAQSRAWRFFVKDRIAAAESVARILALPFHALLMAHGEIVSDEPRQKLARALEWMATTPPARHLAASGQ